MPRALLSVSDKTGIVDLARGLAARGFELRVDRRHARARCRDAGLAVTSVSDAHRLSGDDGRPRQDAAPARFTAASSRAAIAPTTWRRSSAHGIGLVDLVVVNLYPFAGGRATPTTPFDALVEEIDIGGPSLVRAAAKNFRDVLVVVDPGDYPRVLAALDDDAEPRVPVRSAAEGASRTPPPTTPRSRDARDHPAERRHVRARGADGPAAEPFGERLTCRSRRSATCATARIPHQRARPGIQDCRRRAPVAAGFGRRSCRARSCRTLNLLDLDAAARMVLEFDEPAAVVVKHTNPCGAAIGSSPADAYVRARDADCARRRSAASSP